MGVLAPQISGSVLLVSVAIVAVGGARREAEKDVGYGSNTAAMLSVDLGLHGIDEDTGRVIYEELVASARGVADGGFAGLSTWPPVGESEGFIGVRPISPLAPRGTVAARGYFVDSGVMEAVGMKLVSGRFLGRGAGLDSLAVVLDRPTAERYWPGGRAVGQRVEVDRESGGTEVLTVVGIVEAVLTAGRGENRRDHIFMPWGREYSAAVTLHVDGRPGGGALLRRVRDAVSRSQPGLVAVEAATVAEHAGRQLAEAALGAWAMTIVAVLGVIVGVGGAGGLVGLATVRRGREIAVRLALGQSRGGLVVALARPVLAAVVVGAGAGLALAMTWAGAVGAWLEGAPTFSSAATAVSGGIVAVAGLGASLLPALRATKMESVAGLWKV
jgi:putative ABC transport system permease protein